MQWLYAKNLNLLFVWKLLRKGQLSFISQEVIESKKLGATHYELANIIFN